MREDPILERFPRHKNLPLKRRKCGHFSRNSTRGYCHPCYLKLQSKKRSKKHSKLPYYLSDYLPRPD
jgi:hypothetical protein